MQLAAESLVLLFFSVFLFSLFLTFLLLLFVLFLLLFLGGFSWVLRLGEDGQPETVKYHLLSSLLLNELQKLRSEKDAEIAAQNAEIAALRAEMEQRLARLETQESVRVASFRAGAPKRE